MKRYLFITLWCAATLVSLYAQQGSIDPANPGDPQSVYQLSVQVSPQSAGAVNITTTWLEPGKQQYINLTTLKSDYTFVQWVYGEEVVSTSRSFYFTMPKDNVLLIAQCVYNEPEEQPFDPESPDDPPASEIPAPTHLVTIDVSPLEGGTTNKTSFYMAEGTWQTVLATANEDYVFSGWQVGGEIVMVGNPLNIEMGTTDLSFTAVFTYDPQPFNPANPDDPSSLITTDTTIDVFDTICEGTIYKVNSVVYNESGDYTFDNNYIAPNGVNTITHYHLNVHYCESVCADTLPLIGLFNSLSPRDSATYDNTNFTLSWNHIENAVYSVYLWNSTDEPADTPVVKDIAELNYHPDNLVFGNTYRWYVVASNCSYQLVSDTLTFSVREKPDLHITSLELSDAEAESFITIKWTVRNDGNGSTGEQRWTDYIWLVSDMSLGTEFIANDVSLPQLLIKTDNLKSLDSGEEYENTVDIKLPDLVYGDIYVIVAADMYSIVDIEFGDSIVEPYDPQTTGWLFALTNSAYNNIDEYGETAERSDNFFYKRLHLDMPPHIDLQVPSVSAEAIPIDPPEIYKDGKIYGKIPLTSRSEYVSYNPLSYTVNTIQLYTPSPVTYTGVGFNTDFYCGKEVAVHATIANYGTKALEDKHLNTAVYISHSPDRNDDAPLLVKFNSVYVSTLAAGDSMILKINFNLPYAWEGETYFHVFTNYNDEIQEYANTGNNWGVSSPVEVKLTPYADLKPDNLLLTVNGQEAETLVAGQYCNLSCEVNNIGDGIPYTGKWIDRVYISTSPDGIDVSAEKLSDLNRSGTFSKKVNADQSKLLIYAEDTRKTAYYMPLSAYEYTGDNYTYNYRFVTPSLPSGTYYIYLSVDDDNDVFENDSEENNTLRVGPVQIVTPDLAVTDFTISQDTLATDDVVTLTWTVRNTTDAALQNITLTDALYAEINNKPIKIATLTNTLSLPAGGEKVLRANITIPRDQNLEGNYKVYMHINSNDSLPESDIDNNISQKRNVVFQYIEDGSERIIKGMSIVVQNLKANAKTYNVGDAVTLTATIYNNGTKTIPIDISKDIYLLPVNGSFFSQSSAIGLEVISSDGSTLNLASTQTVNITISVRLPEDRQGGTRRLSLVADINNDIKTATNDWKCAYTDIYIYGNQPDIQIDNIYCNSHVFPADEPSAPHTTTLYTSLTDTVNVMVSNTGTWNASSFNMYLYLSEQENGKSIPIGDTTIYSLSVGEQRTISVPITIDDKNNGSWYLTVAVDTNNNLTVDNKIKSIPIQVLLSPVPDLVITDFHIPDLLIVGEKMQITYTITNTGDTATRVDKWADDFYFSSDIGLDDSTATKIGSRMHNGVLAAGESYSVVVEYTIPLDLQGNMIFVISTDATNTVYESDESNNLQSRQVYINNGMDRPADLVIHNIIAPVEITLGKPITLTYTIANRGEYPAKGLLRDVFYFSTDDQLDGSDILVGVAADSIDMEAGQTVTRTAQGIIENVTDGTYYVIVMSNSTHSIAEREYSNNISVSTSPVAVILDELEFDAATQINTQAYFKLSVPSYMEGHTFALDLEYPENTPVGAYVAYGSVPSTVRYDYCSIDLQGAKQQLIVPKAKYGDYYIVVQDHSVSSTGTQTARLRTSVGNEFSLTTDDITLGGAEMTLVAHEIPFGASSLTISEGGQGGWVTTGINGALFDSIMDFRLERTYNTLPAEIVTWDGATQSLVTFNLNDAELGLYNVVSELPEGTQGTLEDAFRVVEGKDVGVTVKLNVPSVSRRNAPIPFSFLYANGGTTDDAISEFVIVIDNGYLSFDVNGLKEQTKELHYRPHGDTNFRGLVSIPPGEQKIVNAFFQVYSNSSKCTISMYILR